MAAEQRAQRATGEPRSRRTPAATADDAATLETAGVPGADEESATLAQMAVAEDMPGLEVDVGAVSSADTESSYPQHAETEPSDPEHVQHPNVGKKGTAKARRARKKRRLAKEKAQGPTGGPSGSAEGGYTPSMVSQLATTQARRRRKFNADVRTLAGTFDLPVPAYASLLPSLPANLRPAEEGGASSSSSWQPKAKASGQGQADKRQQSGAGGSAT